MKKILSLLLVLLLTSAAALAEESDAGALTYAELADWAESYIARAAAAVPMNDPAGNLTADGYEFVYDFATLYADTPVLGADTVVSAVVLTSDEEPGFRGVKVSAALADVLAAYYSENAALAGTRECAVLYAVDQLPEYALWAQVDRDGQRVQTVQYAVHEQLPTGGEGYSDAGVIYTMTENRVSAVRVYGLDSRVSEAEVSDVIYSVRLAALKNDYAQVPFSYTGSDLTAFDEGDLSFSGMDFLSLDGEKAIALLGAPLSDRWMKDGDAGWIRTLTYADCELTFRYDQSKTRGSIYMLKITADGLEGPRAVRCGDTFASVLGRFRSGEGAYQTDGSEALYGVENEGSFGMARYGYDASAELRYGFQLADGRRVVLQMDFAVMALEQVMLYVDE